MFSSTVRFNLDPFDECTDEELWEVLAKVQLTEAIKQLEGQLQEPVAEGGENFSVGLGSDHAISLSNSRFSDTT